VFQDLAMPTRNVVLTDHHEETEAAKLKALREAVNVGFADLDEGRFLDFASFDELGDHLTRVTEDALASRQH
jgi:antitoxin ParD1/3/4